MSETLDFLVGGLPRGGTTIAGRLFNLHPDSYCYAAETHLLPLCMEFAADRPVPKLSLGHVERILLEQNRQVLLEMTSYSVSQGASSETLIFSESDMRPLTDDVMAPISRGLFGELLCAEVSSILRRHFVQRTGKRVVGEKTPNNVFAFDRFGAMGAKAFFMLQREPFAVIRSMRGRGKTDHDIYAAPFRGELLSLVGIYVSYMEAIQSASRHKGARVLRYETMMERPIDLLDDIYKSVGLTADEPTLAKAAEMFKERNARQPWENMSPTERRLIMGLTSKVRAAAGYDDSFYQSRGYILGEGMAAPDEVEEGVEALWGASPRQQGEEGQWLMDEGCLAVTTAPGRRNATIQLWSNYPDAGPLPLGKEGAFIVTEYADRSKVLDNITIQSGRPQNAGVTLDLSKVEPIVADAAGEVRLLAFRATRAFRSYLTPAYARPPRLDDLIHPRRYLRSRGLVGTDRRLMSFAVVGFEAA